MIPLNWKLTLPSTHEGNKGVTVLARVTDPDDPEEIVLLLHSGNQRDHVWNTEIPVQIMQVQMQIQIRDDLKEGQRNGSVID